MRIIKSTRAVKGARVKMYLDSTLDIVSCSWYEFFTRTFFVILDKKIT